MDHWSVGSSLVATLTGITEVNPILPPYRCPQCQLSEFFDDGSVGSGLIYLKRLSKMPIQRGCLRWTPDIRLEGATTRFYGDKVPIYDLNFSGDINLA